MLHVSSELTNTTYINFDVIQHTRFKFPNIDVTKYHYWSSKGKYPPNWTQIQATSVPTQCCQLIVLPLGLFCHFNYVVCMCVLHVH